MDEKKRIVINGVSHKYHLIAKRTDYPLLIMLHGGPGIPNRHAMFKGHEILLEHFMMLGYDQRGCGGSYFGTPAASLTLDQYLDDLDALIDYMCTRFKQSKVYLLGGSWGTELGTLYATRHPEKLHAYIGYGQVVDGHRNESLSYDYVYQRALSAGNADDVKTLTEIGRPVDGSYRKVYTGLRTQRSLLAKYTPSRGKSSSLFQSMVKPIFLSGEYSLRDLVGYIRGVRFTLENAWPRIVNYDFLHETYQFQVPIYIFQGVHDHTTPSSLIETYFAAIRAPYKQLTWFEQSGHGPYNEEKEKFHEHLIQDVLRGEFYETTHS